MDILILRLDAPLMSFGGVMVDQHGPTDEFPGLATLTGLLGNALGYTHGEHLPLGRLQARLEFAARWDVVPKLVIDYHTVDLGQSKMREPGWTTRGQPEHREGGPAAKFGTHQRYRHYWADGVMSVAVTLTGDGPPSVAELASALARPARPLFFGRKSCLPASPVLKAHVEADDVLEALRRFPRDAREFGTSGPMRACWPAHLDPGAAQQIVSVHDRRDWENQIHVGRRPRAEGFIQEVGV